MVMVHSDDKGLVLPPRVAPIQVAIVPIFFKTDVAITKQHAEDIYSTLKKNGIRVYLDDRENYTPGWKFNQWELKGVPIRLELGPKDIANKSVTSVRRDRAGGKDKQQITWDNVVNHVQEELNDMQSQLLQRAREERDDKRKVVTNWSDFMQALNARCAVLAPHCQRTECEKRLKNRSAEDSAEAEDDSDGVNGTTEENESSEKLEKLTGAAKSLCIPFDQPSLADDAICVQCGEKAKNWTLWGRSY
jgi:prolyl-tRNA synthetase